MTNASTQAGQAGAAGSATSFYGLVYTSDPQVWHCPSTGHSIGHGFLHTYEGLRGPDGQCATQLLGLPLSDEYGAADGTTRQDYERGSLVYNAKDSAPWQIYLAAVGNELVSERATVASIQQANARLADELAQAKQRITALEAQLAAAQTPAPAPAAVSASPETWQASVPEVTPEQIAQAAALAFSAAFVAALAAAQPAQAQSAAAPASLATTASSAG